MQKTHHREHLLLKPGDIIIPDVNELIQLMNIKLVILDDLASTLINLQCENQNDISK